MSEPLQTVHVTLNLSRRGGGVASYVWSLADALDSQNVRGTLVSLHDRQLEQQAARHAPALTLLTGAPRGPRSLGVSPRLWRRLDEAVARADVVHLHGLRTLLGRAARQSARRRGKPLVIAPHGQLDPWALAQRRSVKGITDCLWERANFRAASLLHAVSPLEAHHLRAWMPDRPIVLAPPGVSAEAHAFPRAEARAVVDRQWPQLAGKKLILFLGVLMPRKGPQVLVDAWARLGAEWPDWHLVLAGPDIADHRARMEQTIAAAGAEARTSFLGELSEHHKPWMLAAADVFVLPSFSEAFGIAVAEALAAGCPVITTRAAPWPELEQSESGWWIDTGLEPLLIALRDAMTLSSEQRRAMGERGRALVRRCYSWPRAAQRMRAAYDWLLRREPKGPEIFLPDEALPGSMLETLANERDSDPGEAGMN